MFENGIHASVNLETLLGLVKWQNIINEQEKNISFGCLLNKKSTAAFFKKIKFLYFILSYPLKILILKIISSELFLIF